MKRGGIGFDRPSHALRKLANLREQYKAVEAAHSCEFLAGFVVAKDWALKEHNMSFHGFATFSRMFDEFFLV